MMNAILKTGKYLFALPFLVFGVVHFLNAEAMAGMAPFGGSVIIYLTGLALIAGAISIVTGKMDKLGATLLGVFLLLTAFLVHAVGVANAADEAAAGASMSSMLKDIALAGAAWMYAAYIARDTTGTG